MFITNNHDSFQLWWKENFIKHEKVSKYYGQDCNVPCCSVLCSNVLCSNVLYSHVLCSTFLCSIFYVLVCSSVLCSIDWCSSVSLFYVLFFHVLCSNILYFNVLVFYVILLHGWVYLRSFTVYCETKNRIGCYDKNTHTHYNDDHQYFN